MAELSENTHPVEVSVATNVYVVVMLGVASGFEMEVVESPDEGTHE